MWLRAYLIPVMFGNMTITWRHSVSFSHGLHVFNLWMVKKYQHETVYMILLWLSFVPRLSSTIDPLFPCCYTQASSPFHVWLDRYLISIVSHYSALLLVSYLCKYKYWIHKKLESAGAISISSYHPPVHVWISHWLVLVICSYSLVYSWSIAEKTSLF